MPSHRRASRHRAGRATASRCPTCLRRRLAGLTLVEVVVVIVILGILSAVTAPRFLNDKSFLSRGYREELVTALKYAQKLAVASGCPVRMVIDDEGYAASREPAAGNRCDGTREAAAGLAEVRLLGGSAPLGVLVSPPLTITFDALGRPNLARDQTIYVGLFALTVRAESGSVQAP